MNDCLYHAGKTDIIMETKQVGRCYGSRWALKDCSLRLKQGSFTVIVGPSGSGKTTLLHLLAGLISCSEGEIWMRGKRVDTLPAKQRNVAVVFQEPALFPYMNVEENIAFGSSDKDRIHLSKRARETAQLLELDGLLKQRADRLSGGEKQRTAIGRALMKNADIILMDEPFSALDAPLKQSLGERLRRLQQKLHLTILYVTHDQQEAMRLADHLVVMNEGKLIQQGTVRSVYEHPSHVFCAKFIGNPSMNLIHAVMDDYYLCIGSSVIPLPACLKKCGERRRLLIGVRAHQLHYGEGWGNAKTVETQFDGDRTKVLIEWEQQKLYVLMKGDSMIPSHGGIYFDLDESIYFDAETGCPLVLRDRQGS